MLGLLNWQRAGSLFSIAECAFERRSKYMIPAFLVLASTSFHAQAPPPGASANRAQASKQKDPAKDDKKHQEDLAADRDLGKKYSVEVEKEFEIIKDPELQARVDRIGKELGGIANTTLVKATWGDKRLNPFDYKFTIVRPKEKKQVDDVNAFSLPGGYIYVYEGLIKFTESDDELAGVLAHEIAHASFRHVATLQKENSNLSKVQLPLILIAIFAGGVSAAAQTLQVSQLVNQATGSGWSVKAEEAADYGGFQYLLKSKYDPTGMLTFMERLAAQERREPLGYDLGIFRTHPPGRERAESLIKDMKDANLPIRRSRVASSFRVEAKPANDGTVQLSFSGKPLVALAGDDALKRADSAATRLNEFFDSVPEAFEVRVGDDGEIYGGRKELIAFTAADAAAAKTSVDALQKNMITRIRTALFNIGYRVWDGP